MVRWLTLSLLVCLVWATLSSATHAQESPTASTEAARQRELIAGASGSSPPIQPTESTLLKREIELLKDFQDDLLDTVYFTLGFTGTLVVAMLGFTAFLQLRISEEKIRSVEEVLLAKLAKTMAESTSLIKDETVDSIGKIKTSLAQDINKLKAESFSKIDNEVKLIKTSLWHIRYNVYDSAVTHAKDEHESIRKSKIFVEHILGHTGYEDLAHDRLKTIIEKLNENKTYISIYEKQEWIDFAKKLPVDCDHDKKILLSHIHRAC